MGKLSADKSTCHAPKMRQKRETMEEQPASDGFVLGQRIADYPRNFSFPRYQNAATSSKSKSCGIIRRYRASDLRQKFIHWQYCSILDVR